MAEPAFPVVLRHGRVTLRPLSVRDLRPWAQLRADSHDWLVPWEATIPGAGDAPPPSYRTLLRRYRRAARGGYAMPFVVDVEGQFAGQLNISSITYGSMMSAFIGYWLGERFAGRGVMPVAVALAVDYALTTAGLHRIEIDIRPENAPSLRVVEKLGLREEGRRERLLHIDGQWRDHRTFAITAEELGDGLLARLIRSFDTPAQVHDGQAPGT